VNGLASFRVVPHRLECVASRTGTAQGCSLRVSGLAGGQGGIRDGLLQCLPFHLAACKNADDRREDEKDDGEPSDKIPPLIIGDECGPGKEQRVDDREETTDRTEDRAEPDEW
jgi:hypothetical protein